MRVDAGVESGSVIGGQFDSLLAKLIVTGADRAQALERSRRALAEFRVEGMASVLPFHRLVVPDPAFTADTADGFGVHTRWIEAERDNTVTPFTGGTGTEPDTAPRHPIVVEVGGRRVAVSLPADLALGAAAGPRARTVPRRSCGANGSGATVAGDALVAPMQGTLVKVAVRDGDRVAAGDLIVVLEAMKMEYPVTAHRDGTIRALSAEPGDPLAQGAVICEITTDS
jgi:acetyl-CoA/propionyl-CoA carboxylase biotin carboxyl carrier protein